MSFVGSLSSGTGGEQWSSQVAEEERSRADIIRRLVRGQTFRKLNKLGVAKLRYVWCSPDLSKIMWGDPPSGGRKRGEMHASGVLLQLPLSVLLASRSAALVA